MHQKPSTKYSLVPHGKNSIAVRPIPVYSVSTIEILYTEKIGNQRNMGDYWKIGKIIR